MVGDGERGQWLGHVHSSSLKLGNLSVLSRCRGAVLLIRNQAYVWFVEKQGLCDTANV